MLSVLDYKCFFALIKRNRVSTIDIGFTYVLESGIVLIGPKGNILYLIDIVEKKKEVKFLLDCLSTYN